MTSSFFSRILVLQKQLTSVLTKNACTTNLHIYVTRLFPYPPDPHWKHQKHEYKYTLSINEQFCKKTDGVAIVTLLRVYQIVL